MSSRYWPTTPLSLAQVSGVTSRRSYWAVRRNLELPGTYPDTVLLLTGEQHRRIGDDYLRRIRASTTSWTAERFTYKVPSNFSAIGLIRLVPPKAGMPELAGVELANHFAAPTLGRTFTGWIAPASRRTGGRESTKVMKILLGRSELGSRLFSPAE